MPLSLRVILALQVPICTRAASLSLKELETLQIYLQYPRCSHLPTHRSHHPLAHTTLPGTRESTHNKRPGPATPRRRLGPRSAASFNNDKPLAQLLGPGSPSPLTTWRNAAHLRPPPRVRLPVLSPRAQLPILSATPRFKPGVTRQKRQVPAAPGRPHAPPAARPGPARRSEPFEERRAGRRRAEGAPALPSAPLPPSRPCPQLLPRRRRATHRSAKRRRRGSLWPCAGLPPGAVLAGLGAAGAAGRRRGRAGLRRLRARGSRLQPLVRGCASAGPH